MATTRVFKSGNSQAVRIPKEFQFDVKEVEIIQRGDELILRRPRTDLGQAFELLNSMPSDFKRDEPVRSTKQQQSWDYQPAWR